MYVPSSPDRVESLAQQRAEDAVRHRRVLNEMIDVGAELTRLLLRQAAAQVEAAVATAQSEAAPDPAKEDWNALSTPRLRGDAAAV